MKISMEQRRSVRQQAIDGILFLSVIIIASAIWFLLLKFSILDKSISEESVIITGSCLLYIVIASLGIKFYLEIFPQKNITLPLYITTNLFIILLIYLILSSKILSLPFNEIIAFIFFILYFFFFRFTYKLLYKRRLLKLVEKNKQDIRHNPNSFEAYYNLGFSYKELKKFKDAVSAFKQAIRINSSHADAYYQLGSSYDFLGFFTESINAFKQAIEIRPDFAEAHYELGTAYCLSKDREAALKEYVIMKSLNPALAKKLLEFINDIDKFYRRGKIIR